MEVKKETRNELFKRHEIQIIVKSEKTPSYIEATKLISEKLKIPEEHIMVEKVNGKFGRNTFLISASAYDTKELKEDAVKRLIKPKKAKVGEAAA